MDLNKMFDGLKINKDECFLTNTQDLESFKDNKDFYKILNFLYDNKQEKVVHRLGTIMNSIFTQHSQVFIFSWRTLQKLYASDVNSKFKGLNSPDYNLLLAKITNSGLFEVLRPPTGKKGGVYKLIEPDLVGLLQKQVGIKYLEFKEQKVLEYYDSGGKEGKELSPEEIKQKIKKVKENIRRKLNKGESHGS